MKNLSLLLFLVTSITFAQSPWTQKKGKLYTQLSYTIIPEYTEIFGNSELNLHGISDNTINFYGEIGLSDKTTLILTLPYKLIKVKQSIICSGPPCFKDISESTFGNIELGLKHNFYKKDWVLSGQLSVEANTGSFDAASGIRTGYDAWSFTPLFLAGKSFGKSYLQTFIGANIRTNNYSSNFKIGGEYGKKLSSKLWLIGFLDVVKSLKNGDAVLTAINTFTGLYVNDQDYGAFGFKGIYEFKNDFGINAGLGGAFFGNNVAKSPALTFGVYHKF
ncbi:hypothetical protein OD91_1672 [Lutibacter sp. Hel_I_33_5]|uniref:transporter n=1 Tax=Lutibacter sp. Hel_I_33_5 TaxID=1566289 RepID=UPI0011A03BD1|nr:transporter [Lutibacter sp. Hel_I_33_5]TVZ56387.1 hypothetical protein OD91_1672 [Lutibacter sp. Hel_I_33_5]